MSKRSNAILNMAKKAKNDEFYTQYEDVELEMEVYIGHNPNVFMGKTILCPCNDGAESAFARYFVSHFVRLGLGKLICVEYSPKSKERGKTLTLTHDTNHNGRIDIDDLEWAYLEGDGDFRSEEVTRLRDEADIIVTNPPFSLFREFIAWIMEGGKQFAIIGNMNAITYKEVFPLIKNNKIWLGATGNGKDMVFAVPKGAKVDEKDKQKAARLGYIGDYTRLGNSCWYSNIEHGRRHQPLALMTMEDNLRYNKKMKGKDGYERYDNYDAIEVPFTDAIPSDYEGVMGVPISFLDKYCPEQFEILGSRKGDDGRELSINGWRPYDRILIRHRTQS